MSAESTTPLLDRASVDSRNGSLHSPDPQNASHARSDGRSEWPRDLGFSAESTPLLQHQDDDGQQYGTATQNRSSSPSLHESSSHIGLFERKDRRPRWAIIITIALLTVAVLLILALGFSAPAVVKEYAQQAAVFTPQRIALDSATPTGIRARIQGDVVLDGSRVRQKSVRDIGRLATWIAREIETGETEVHVYLPEYGNVLLGTASIPPVKLKIQDGHANHIDILTDLESGDVAGLRRLANDWMAGRLGQLRIKGSANVNIKSGWLNLGNQVISAVLAFDGHDIPPLPSINVTRLNVHEAPWIPGSHVVAVDVSVSISNDYALELAIPPLGFNILLPNCSPMDPYILVADATTDVVDVQPAKPAVVGVSGIVKRLPEELTTACPGQKDSPLDQIISSYIQGFQTIIYVRGAAAPSPETPSWMVDLLKSVTIPVPITGHEFEHLIKNFSMTDVHFSMPDPFSEPDTPEAKPMVSAVVKVFINLPEQMNFEVDIPRVRANVDVSYQGDKFGYLDLSKWQPTNATRINDTSSDRPLLLVAFEIRDGPLQVTNNDKFSEVVQALLFGKKPVGLSLDALVDGEVKTSLGDFILHDIPAQGHIEVTSPFRKSIGAIDPKVESVKVLHTTDSTVTLQTTLNFTNPTPYSASIPFVDILLLYNGTALAHLTARSLSVVPGTNTGVLVEAFWSPLASSGQAGVIAGRELISGYLSGFNTTVVLQSHNGSIPGLPGIGQALSDIKIEMPVPKLHTPGSGDGVPDETDGGKPHFIKDATLHVWSSTAVFTLASPLPESTVFIDNIDAVALYNHTEPIGRIEYSLPFAVPPGISQTPRLPVDLDLNGVGYDAVRKALGGTLRMDAKAKIGVTLGEYSTVIFYQGKGIGAKIRI